MDIYCPKCAEPVELDYLHTVADDNDTTFDVELGRFQTLGCEAIGASHNPNKDNGRASAAAAMYDLLGDDIDGAAAMLEDFEALGYFN
jgi:hypothetical protein